MRKSRWPVASCEDDFAPYLAGKAAASVAMFGRFVEMARSAGPVTFELHNGPVVLCGTRRIFASVRAVDAGLAGQLNLMRHVTDRRIRKAEKVTSSLFRHRYLVTALADLDDEFGEWLAEAWDVGDGAHLT
jgi:hypothetical protein